MPTDIVDEFVSDEIQRTALERRLGELDDSRVARLTRLRAAIAKLQGFVPLEGQGLSEAAYEQIAKEQVTMHRVLEAEGVVQALERVVDRGRKDEIRNAVVAVALLGERTMEGAIHRLKQVSQFPPGRDPHHPHRVCQSEIFRHYRGYLGQFVDPRDFPENAESVALQSKIISLDQPPSPGHAAQATPGTPTKDYCAPSPNVIQWQGELEIRSTLWRLFVFLISRTAPGDNPISFNTLRSDVYRKPSGDKKDGSIKNDISQLNRELSKITFPWNLSTLNEGSARDKRLSVRFSLL